MSEHLGSSDVEVAAIIEAFDALTAQVDRHIESLEAEQGTAEASGDPRYVQRIERGLSCARVLLDALEGDDVLEQIMTLRHNARQLGFAREGKIV
ncbi:MAG: hypothetical protein GEU73_11070 [Chloroflexi bacterium]|nr:hypothetical protein [Chloroflexota bacterium]